MDKPCEDAARKRLSASRGERPRGKPSLPTPRSQTRGLRKCEKSHSCRSSCPRIWAGCATSFGQQDTRQGTLCQFRAQASRGKRSFCFTSQNPAKRPCEQAGTSLSEDEKTTWSGDVLSARRPSGTSQSPANPTDTRVNPRHVRALSQGKKSHPAELSPNG